MAHPRRIRRTKGNLQRWSMKYGVQVRQNVAFIGNLYWIETYAYLADRKPRLDVSVKIAETTTGATNVDDYLRWQRERAVMDLAEQFNLFLEVFPHVFGDEVER